MRNISIAFRYLLVMTLLTGIIYPAMVWGVAQSIWPKHANGSLVWQDDRVLGSSLIAQKFSQEKYFWPRPSACDYNAAASSASNQGPTSANLKKSFDTLINSRLSEMKLASASGLDPHITPAAALEQLDRVALARQLTSLQKTRLEELIKLSIEKRTWGFLGEPRVNVLLLNLKLDKEFL